MALTVWENVTVTGQYAGLVASSWKGQTYLRSAPAKVNNNSPKQQEHKRRYAKAYTVISQLYNIFLKKHYHFAKMTPANAVIKSCTADYWDFENQGANDPWFNGFGFPSGNLNAYITGEAIFSGTAPNYKWQFSNINIMGTDANKCTGIFIFCCGAEDTLISFTTMDKNEHEKEFKWSPYNRGAWKGFLIPFNDNDCGIPVDIQTIRKYL